MAPDNTIQGPRRFEVDIVGSEDGPTAGKVALCMTMPPFESRTNVTLNFQSLIDYLMPFT